MNGGTAASTDYELYPNWLPTGVWQGLFSGSYGGGLGGQDVIGSYWSSTAFGTGLAYNLSFGDEHVYPNYVGGEHVGYAVRCTI